MAHIRTFLQGRFSLWERHWWEVGWRTPKGSLEVLMVNVDHFIVWPWADLAQLPGSLSGLGP